MSENIVLTLVGIVVAGALCQWLAWWLRLPAILFLLLTGIVAGPLTGLLQPDRLFGDLLFPLVSLGVAVVLFEGSLSLRLHEIAGLGRVVRNLVTIGVLINWLGIAAATHLFAGFSWDFAFLFGAVVVVSGPTVITPLLRAMRPTAAVANVLRWEGILIDPLGALLAVLVFDFIVSGQQGGTLRTFGAIVLGGVLIGAAGGYGLAQLLRRHLMPEFLFSVTTLAAVLGVFTLANAVERESGLLAVTMMGMVMANMKDVPIEEVAEFKESLSVLLISALFIILGARLEFSQLDALGGEALLVLAAILLVSRPLAVAVATLGSPLNWRERALLGWVAPRGIVAAAVSAVFALRLEATGSPEAGLLVALTFMVIIATVVLQSASARPLTRLLGLAEAEPCGVLVIGADAVARAVAGALEEQGFPTLLVDANWENVRAARMAGRRTYYGHAVSEHADRYLNLAGLGHLFAMSPRSSLNALACTRYRRDFGGGHVFSLQSREERDAPHKRAPARAFSCTRLFGDDVSLAKLASLLARGGEIHATRLSEGFDWAAYQRRYRRHVVPLFAVDGKGRLRVFSNAGELAPEPGWSVVGLLAAEALEQRRREARPDGAAKGATTPRAAK